nr:hypothetical protein Iba_chr11dCG7350 [Ipomoea batatas]
MPLRLVSFVATGGVEYRNADLSASVAFDGGGARVAGDLVFAGTVVAVTEYNIGEDNLDREKWRSVSGGISGVESWARDEDEEEYHHLLKKNNPPRAVWPHAALAVLHQWHQGGGGGIRRGAPAVRDVGSPQFTNVTCRFDDGLPQYHLDMGQIP